MANPGADNFRMKKLAKVGKKSRLMVSSDNAQV